MGGGREDLSDVPLSHLQPQGARNLWWQEMRSGQGGTGTEPLGMCGLLGSSHAVSVLPWTWCVKVVKPEGHGSRLGTLPWPG